MATAPATTGAPTRAPETSVNANHTVNGCTIGGADPDVYIDQAHGILAFISAAAAEAGGFDELLTNDKIIGSAVDGAMTLIELASQALAHERALSEKLRQGRGAVA